VAGGGRYDDLVQRFTGGEVPACGASIGVDRLLAALRSLGKIDAGGSDGPVVVTVMSSGRLPEYQAMVSELRAANIASELYLGTKAIGGQLKYADKRRSPAAVIVGAEEFGGGTVVVKDLTRGKEVAATISDRQEWLAAGEVQRTVPRSELVDAVAQVLERRRRRG
jgi:histidyl-tRNA synthetase